MGDGDGDQRREGKKSGRRKEEELDAASGRERRQTHEHRTGDGAEAPCDVEQGDEASARAWDGDACDDIAGGEACSQTEADREEREVRLAKAGPDHGGASGCTYGGSIEDAGAEIARGEPRSAEPAGEAGGEEGAGLGVLDVPALDESGQKRAEHNGGNARGDEIQEDGN